MNHPLEYHRNVPLKANLLFLEYYYLYSLSCYSLDIRLHFDYRLVTCCAPYAISIMSFSAPTGAVRFY
jgi:hypothetical protein